jgi:hypothetical protein
MSDHLGLIEMLSIFGIGLALVIFEVVRTNLVIRRDRQDRVASTQSDDPHDPLEKP